MCVIQLCNMSRNLGEKVSLLSGNESLGLTLTGGFCGYRNIQMMCSYIIGVESQGCDRLRGKIPSIFDIQEYIEHAWDLGINAQGRVETGGIRGTRKYIGTPDVGSRPAIWSCASLV
jgi:hypothetical protein